MDLWRLDKLHVVSDTNLQLRTGKLSILLEKASVENSVTNRSLTTLHYPMSPLKKVELLCSR